MDHSSRRREASRISLDKASASQIELRQLLAAAAQAETLSRREGVSIDPQAYDDVFKKMTKEVGQKRSRLAREHKAAEERWALLEGHPQARRLMMIRNDRRFQIWGLYKCLLERHRNLTSESQFPEAEEAAELAVEVARSLDPTEHGAERLADFRAGALAALADARRHLANFEGAREALEQAREDLEKGTGDPLEEAELEHLWGQLQRDLGEEEEAERSLRRASTLYRRIGDPRLQSGSQGDPDHGHTAHRGRAYARRGR